MPFQLKDTLVNAWRKMRWWFAQFSLLQGLGALHAWAKAHSVFYQLLDTRIRQPLAHYWTVFNYVLPVQLLIYQFRNHTFLLLFWILLMLIVTQNALSQLGGPLLFLEPEYHNQFSPTSMCLLGISFGVFTIAYQITCYILHGHRFYFLSVSKYPFIVFSLNNSILPLLFWWIYIFSFIDFHAHEGQLSTWEITQRVLGLSLGGLSITAVAYGYFSWTSTDVLKLVGSKISQELKNSYVILREARQSVGFAVRVDYYLPNWWSVKRVPLRVQGDLRSIAECLNRNHSYALVAESCFLLLLVVMGWFQYLPFFRLPAAASFMVLFSFFIMLIGAFSFWLRRIGLLALAIVLLAFWYVNQNQQYVGTNYAFGLDYNQPAPAPYTLQTLSIHRDSAKVDRANNEAILNNWLCNWNARYNPPLPLPYRRPLPQVKPRIVILCVSGGGTRAAMWAMRCLQSLDSTLAGRMMHHTTLIAGASGGMISAAYYRELYFKHLQQLGPNEDAVDSFKPYLQPELLQNVGRDLLNPIVLNLTTNLLLPPQYFRDSLSKNRYQKDRGYAFEQQLVENTGCFANRRLGDYRETEAAGQIPMLILSPSIANDGRRMLISPQPLSHLIHSPSFNPFYQNEVSDVEFCRLLANAQPENLKFSSALRMSATFPAVLPFVALPTDPRIEVMDAGIIDNFGIQTALKYIYVNKDWIKRHTNGVMIVQIRDSPRQIAVPSFDKPTLVQKAKRALAETYHAFVESKDFGNDEYLTYIKSIMGQQLQYIELEYIPSRPAGTASLSFHLTQREKEDIIQAIDHPTNRLALDYIQRYVLQLGWRHGIRQEEVNVK
jgi:hypothetical protein